MGVSTRKVTEITEQLCGLEISATQVSRVAGMLDEELEEFRSRELGEYPIVYLDAHYEKVRRGGRVQDVAILKAIGVNRFGTREVLGLSARISEAEVPKPQGVTHRQPALAEQRGQAPPVTDPPHIPWR